MTRILAIALLMSTAACSQSPGDEKAADAGATADANAVAENGLTGETGFVTAANCAAYYQSVSRLYGSIATNAESEAEGAEMRQLASQRETISSAFRQAAQKIGTTLGKGSGDVDAVLTEAEAAVDKEFKAREFEDFADWVAGEADRCPAKALSETLQDGTS